MAAATSTVSPYQQIPQELTERPQWVTWRLEMRDGKLTKVPYNPLTGKHASSTKPQTWGTFAQALEALSRTEPRYDGIGYVFSKDDPYTGVDLDHCWDSETGEIATWARAIVDTFASYAEISPSGEGVHIFLRASMAADARHKNGTYEAYSQERFFTVTGEQLEGTPATIEERQAELDGFLARYLPQRATASAAPARDMGAGAPLSMDDEELLMRARNNPDQVKAARFQRLYDAGDASGYKSASEADAALINDLAYMCGRNAEGRVADLFRCSALYREKAEREDYLTRTIAFAYAGRSAFYTPRTAEKSIEKQSIEKAAPAFAAEVLEALEGNTLEAGDAGENQLIISGNELREALARIRELEEENAAQRQEITSLRQSVASMNGKMQDIRNIIDADGLQVAPLEKVLEIDLLLHAIWPSHEGRREPDGSVPIIIEAPRDEKTGKIKGDPGLADKHGVSRGTISKALDNLHAFGACRVTRTPSELQPNGLFRSRVLVAPPVCLQPKEWVRPDGPRKQMGGARPGAGRKAKCATPGCDGELLERRGVETREHEFIETQCTGVCGETTRRYTGVVTSQGSRWVGENQLIFDDAPEVSDAGDKSERVVSVDASIVRKIENLPEEDDAEGEPEDDMLPPAAVVDVPSIRLISTHDTPLCPTCGSETHPSRGLPGYRVCRSCCISIRDAEAS